MTDLLDRPLGRRERSSLVDEGHFRMEEPLKASLDAPASRPVEPLRVRFSGPPAPDWLPELVPRFREYLALPRGWDSYGARTVSRDAVIVAIRILAGVARRPDHVLPTSGGGVQLEWDGDIDLELEVKANGIVESLLEQDGKATEAVYFSNSGALADLLARL